MQVMTDSRPMVQSTDVWPWKDALQSRAGSELLDRNRMTGWPTFSPCRNTSTGEDGPLDAPPVKPAGAKSSLKRLMQDGPHDGVAAPAVPAVIAPTVPTPPTRVSVAAAASTLLLMDMDVPLLEPTAVPCARLSELASAARGPEGSRPARHAAGSRWPDQDGNGRPDRSCSFERESPGQARKSRWGLNRSNRLNKAEVRQLRKRNALVTG